MTVNQATLELWLDTDPSRFERYVTDHPEVTDLFESLTALPDRVRSTLSEALAIPTDFLGSLRSKLRPVTGTEGAAVALDLLGVGSETLRLFFTDDL